jgi:hypothetical protein
MLRLRALVLNLPTVVAQKEHLAVLESIVLFGFEHAFPQTAHGKKVLAQQILVAYHGAGNHVRIVQIDNGKSRVDIIRLGTESSCAVGAA